MTYLFRIHSLANAFWFISFVSLLKLELEMRRLLGKYNPSPSTPQPPGGQHQFYPQYHFFRPQNVLTKFTRLNAPWPVALLASNSDVCSSHQLSAGETIVNMASELILMMIMMIMINIMCVISFAFFSAIYLECDMH